MAAISPASPGPAALMFVSVMSPSWHRARAATHASSSGLGTDRGPLCPPSVLSSRGGGRGGEESSWVAEGVGPYLGWAVPEHEPPADARLLAAYLRPERRAIAALTAILVVAMVLPLAGPVLVGRFVDAA